MPTSTQHGFLTGKWELKYLKRRFRAHRNQVAAAKPAIDSRTPPERPHLAFKLKKALSEERRQAEILAENFRILKSTAEIMGEDEYNKFYTTTRISKQETANAKLLKTVHFNIPENGTGMNRSKDLEHNETSLTAITKRNYRILHRWFQIKIGKCVPWWAQIRY